MIQRPADSSGWKTPQPAATFPLMIAVEAVQVRYATQYFPDDDTGLASIFSPQNPPQAYPLSDTGYFSFFVRHDALRA